MSKLDIICYAKPIKRFAKTQKEKFNFEFEEKIEADIVFFNILAIELPDQSIEIEIRSKAENELIERIALKQGQFYIYIPTLTDISVKYEFIYN